MIHFCSIDNNNFYFNSVKCATAVSNDAMRKIMVCLLECIESFKYEHSDVGHQYNIVSTSGRSDFGRSFIRIRSEIQIYLIAIDE